jgi:hypothetical protein
MSYFQRLAEQKILEAIERGDFENLELAGKPLNLSDYFDAPPELRAAYHILKNAGVVPEEVELLNSIHRITKHIRSELTKDEKERLTREKVLLQTRLDMIRERRLIHGI